MPLPRTGQPGRARWLAARGYAVVNADVLRASVRPADRICTSSSARVGGAHIRILRHVIILIFEFAHIHRGVPSKRQQPRFGLHASVIATYAGNGSQPECS